MLPNRNTYELTDNNKFTIYLPNNKKRNNEYFHKQKGPFCTVYTLLHILDFFECYPPYYEREYPENFKTVVSEFKFFRSFSQAFNANEEIDELIREEIKKDFEDETLSEEKMDKELDKYKKLKLIKKILNFIEEHWPLYPLPPTVTDEKIKKLYLSAHFANDLSNFFGSMLGFEEYNISNNFTPQHVKQMLDTLGPLFIAGQNLTIDLKSDRFTYEGIITNSKNSYKLESRSCNSKRMMDFGHAVMLVGIDLNPLDSPTPADAQIYYIDPNFPQWIIKTSFREFTSLGIARCLFFPCQDFPHNYFQHPVGAYTALRRINVCHHVLDAQQQSPCTVINKRPDSKPRALFDLLHDEGWGNNVKRKNLNKAEFEIEYGVDEDTEPKSKACLTLFAKQQAPIHKSKQEEQGPVYSCKKRKIQSARKM